jgi:uncharacterized linocin/CFP29 family protein
MPNNSAEVDWDEPTWKEINDAVAVEVGKVRVAQKVFPTTVFDTSPTEIPDDVIDFADFSIKEGRTKAFVEIYQVFSLTATQVAKEPQIKAARTLARMAAKAIALAEDTIVFQGADGALPGNVEADKALAGKGLAGAAGPRDANDGNASKVSVPIEVPQRQKDQQPPIWGENLFSAVTAGISKLTAKAQAPKYALFLPVDAYADTFVPPSNASLVTTAERIRPLVEGGFYGTGTLPAAVRDDDPARATPGTGLLVALGGDPTTLCVGREAEAEFVRKDGGKYFFRVVERVQFVARDPRAFVLLKLNGTPPAGG